MTKTQIEYFIAVVREQSYTRAANALYISQPAISKGVSKLEDELGFRLFTSADGLISVTPAGAMLYEFLLRVTEEYRALLDNIGSRLDDMSRLIRLGCPNTWNPAFFYSRLEEHFRAKYPDLRLSVECCKLSDLISRLQSGRLDVALTHDFYMPARRGIRSEQLTDTGCGILYSKEHFKNVTSPRDFISCDFLLFDNDIEKKFSEILDTLCGAYGFTPRIVNDGQLSTALFNTACGRGVMLFSDWDSAVSNRAYGFFPLRERMPIRIIYDADRRDSTVDLFVREAVGLFSGGAP